MGSLDGTCTRLRISGDKSRPHFIDLWRLPRHPVGRVVGHPAQARKKQSVAMKRHAMAKREWISMPKESWPTETYVQEIQLRLLDFKIVKIASTLGISEPYAAEIRDGRSRPHPRHWNFRGIWRWRPRIRISCQQPCFDICEFFRGIVTGSAGQLVKHRDNTH